LAEAERCLAPFPESKYKHALCDALRFAVERDG